MNLLKSLLFFIVLLVLSRLIPHPPNFTPLIAGAVFLPFMLKDRSLIIGLPLLCLFISDLIIGFHSLMLWTYGAFLIIGLTVFNISKLNLKTLLGLSLASPTIFYIVSNFGVWLSAATYTKDLNGLLAVAYTHLTLPTKRIVESSGGAESVKKRERTRQGWHV